MATEPNWNRPWGDQTTVGGYPSAPTSLLGEAAEHVASSAPLKPALPLSTATLTTRLPPISESLDAVEATLLAAARSSSSSTAVDNSTSPNLAWQYNPPGTLSATKKRRIGDAEERAYSTTRDSGSYHTYNQPPKPGFANASTLPPEAYKRHDSHTESKPDHVFDGSTAAATVTATRQDSTSKSLEDLAFSTRCCISDCPGKRCTTVRALLVDIINEFCSLDSRLQGAFAAGPVESPTKAPELERQEIEPTLVWMLNRLRWNNAGIRSLGRAQPKAEVPIANRLDRSGTEPPLEDGSGTPVTAASDWTEGMKRRWTQADKEGQRPPLRANPSIQPVPAAPQSSPHSSVSYAMPSHLGAGGPHSGVVETSWQLQNQHGAEQPPLANSPQRMGGPAHLALQTSQHSPMHGPQHQGHHGLVLPSPSSLGQPPSYHGGIPLEMNPSASSASPHSVSQVSSSAHIQHLQDLQHQVSTKTLALQTLQREHDDLLAKLERQRTKCLTLEKKFEVTDVEINSLTDERERLQAQLAALDSQNEELTRGRDEARKEMVESGKQYVRIVEMANRLQAKSAEDGKQWEEEKTELTARIKALELGYSGDLLSEDDMARSPRAKSVGDGDFEHRSRGRDLDKSYSEGGMVSTGAGSGSEDASADYREQQGPHPTVLAPRSSSLHRTVLALRAETRRLQARTQVLESVIRKLMAENGSLHESLVATVTASNERMKEAIAEELGAT